MPAEPLLQLALYQPSIPPNTGNIGRLCVGMGARLHIIGPCAFDFSDKALRRAGLDYWPHLDWRLHEQPADFLAWLDDRRPWLVTKFGRTRFDQAAYAAGEVLILGNELHGLPQEWHARWPERQVAIPVFGQIRSYNQANAAAMLLSQAMRACGGFDGWRPPG